MMQHVCSSFGWITRAATAVGSDRFPEIMARTLFYWNLAAENSSTPGEDALINGLQVMVEDLYRADNQARALLRESVSGMSAADATQFVALCEGRPEEIC